MPILYQKVKIFIASVLYLLLTTTLTIPSLLSRANCHTYLTRVKQHEARRAKPPNPEKAIASDSEKQVTEQVKGIGSYLETLQDENQCLRDQNRCLQRSVDSYRDGHKTQCVNVPSFIFVVYALGYGACRFVDYAFRHG